MLPPLKNNVGDLVERKCGCQFEKCAHAACKNKELKLDTAGNHGLVCHPGVKAMRATLIEKALEKGFVKLEAIQPSSLRLTLFLVATFPKKIYPLYFLDD